MFEINIRIGERIAMKRIYEQLLKYRNHGPYPFHMPGHKRKIDDCFAGIHPYEMDFTEIDGLDDLHEPEEMFREDMDEMKAFYGTKESFFLVNGSTSGIMAAIASVCDLHDTIIISRNCHKSVYFAIELLGLHPIYIYPTLDEKNGTVINIDAVELEKIVEKHLEAKAVMLVSPTYEGKVMDIPKISTITKKHHMALIVDEAHGAHFSFGNEFPESAITQGADLVIQSLHKTMPALTQTALLHVCTDRILPQKVQESIDCFETSSPSYLFAASMEHAIDYGMHHEREFQQYYHRMKRLREQLAAMKHFYILDTEDVGKVAISTAKSNMTGKQLYDILLSNYGLQMEMAQETYCLAMTSIYDEEEDLKRIVEALLEIDQMAEKKKAEKIKGWTQEESLVYIPYEAKRKKQKSVALEESLGKISGEYLYLYPPGIPLLVPGERINEKSLQKIQEYKEKQFVIKGMEDKKAEKIKVIVEE